MQSAITARLCLALALLGILPPALAAPQTVILYGDDDYAPYSYVEHGAFKGMYIDILRQSASEGGWPERLDKLNNVALRS